MLPKIHRLRLSREIESVLKAKKAVKEDSLLMKFLKNSTPNSRFAIIVSSQIFNKATKRNRARRLLSEAILQLLPKLKRGFDVAFMTLPGFKLQDLKTTQYILEKLFLKAKMM